MLNKIAFSGSFLTILFIHFILFDSSSIKKEPFIVAQKPTVIAISLQKVNITQKKIKKVEPKVIKKIEPKSVVKPKPVIKKPKIVKEAKRKVQKKTKKKIVRKKIKDQKKEPKKIVKKAQPKLIKTVTKQLPKTKAKKTTVTETVKNHIKNEYLLKLRALIESNKKYPKRAKRLKQQGKVIVAFSISKYGYIQGINLKSKSRYRRLNNAALDILKRIAKFEPIPKELQKTNWAIEIPISYYILNV